MTRGNYVALLALASSAVAAAEAPPDEYVCPAGSAGCGPALHDQVLMQLNARMTNQKRRKLQPAYLGAQRHIAGVPVHNYHLALLDHENATNWNVIFSHGTTDAHLQEVCQAFTDHPSHAKCKFQGEPSEGGFAYICVHCTEKEMEEVFSKFPGDKKGEEIEPDLVTQMIPDEPLPKDAVEGSLAFGVTAVEIPWGLDRIDEGGMDQAYNVFEGGEGVHVYVLDTGVRTTHVDFEGRAVPTLESLGRLTECKPEETTCAADMNGHGTHCAGTIAGKTYGVAKKSEIFAVKVLDNRGQGMLSWICSAVDWVMRTHQRMDHNTEAAVISMSLGGPGNTAMHQASITRAVNAGITVVVAAGNDNADACGFSPAFVRNAITVGSTTRDDTMSSFSNYGDCVDIFAPGSDIRSTSKDSDTGMAIKSGTSMACPHVAGVAALVLGKHHRQGHRLSPAQVREYIISSASVNKISDIPMNPKSPNLLLSAKIIDATNPSPPVSPPVKHGRIIGDNSKIIPTVNPNPLPFPIPSVPSFPVLQPPPPYLPVLPSPFLPSVPVVPSPCYPAAPCLPCPTC